MSTDYTNFSVPEPLAHIWESVQEERNIVAQGMRKVSRVLENETSSVLISQSLREFSDTIDKVTKNDRHVGRLAQISKELDDGTPFSSEFEQAYAENRETLKSVSAMTKGLLNDYGGFNQELGRDVLQDFSEELHEVLEL